MKDIDRLRQIAKQQKLPNYEELVSVLEYLNINNSCVTEAQQRTNHILSRAQLVVAGVRHVNVEVGFGSLKERVIIAMHESKPVTREEAEKEYEILRSKPIPPPTSEVHATIYKQNNTTDCPECKTTDVYKYTCGNMVGWAKCNECKHEFETR